jgi:ATP-binding cassette subfamily F protein 3
VIQFRHLTLARAGRTLIEDANAQIHSGWRVGLVGANGTGKSSLFALIRGELHAEHGDVEVPPAWRIASVAQETPALAQEAIEYVLDGDTELRAVERALSDAESAHDGHRVAELHARLDEIDGYGARARASALLAGLGFAPSDSARPVASFSGGWRMRLNLARALIERSDLLLLDEPTNHLDVEAIVWLEKWLAGYRGTLMLVSHDRDFLDGCATHVAHIAARRLTLYTGNYSAFEAERAGQLATQQAMFERQQREIAHLERFIERFRAKATKARQAQSRLKALDRMERIAPAHVDAPFDFHFADPDRAPDPLLALDRVTAGYPSFALREVTLTLRPGARIGLLGPNGAGKSTFVKLLAGELPPLAGTRQEGRGLAIGYFAQHQLEQLRPAESPLQHMIRLEPHTREQDLRDYLGGFDFRGGMADAPVEPFSGGEKSRLALALLVRRRPNLLLLDEPTNHLDLEMRHALTKALAEYEGSLVLVSHDRALLRTVCDSFLLVSDESVREFDGDLDDYLAWLNARREQGAAAKEQTSDKLARKQARAAAAADRQAKLAQRRPLLKEVETLESCLAAWHQEKREIDESLADPSFYESPDPDKLKGLALRQSELTRLIGDAEQRWLEVNEALEEIGEIERT